MSWHFSRALVAEYSAENCSDGERFAPLNTTPTPQAYCSPDRMTAFYRLSRFGMTFAPLTDAHGEELLTWFRAGFPARTSAQPEKAQDSTESEAASGWKWPASSVKYDRASRSWRTRQCSLLAGLDVYSETWPKWGSMRDGECWELPTLAHTTSETGSGLWPTPTKSDGTGGPGNSGRAGGLNLRTAVVKWPTPLATDGSKGGPNQKGGKGDLRLASAVHQFPTPTATNTKANHMRGADKGKEREARSYGATGQLNPTWVEWLMGWPLGWTALDVLETDKSHSAPLKRGAC